MKRLTPEQVQENNVVAREVIQVLRTKLEEMKLEKAADKRLWKTLSFWGKFCFLLASDPDEKMTEIYREHTYKMMLFELKLYFIGHYKTGGYMSQFTPPRITFTKEKDYILFQTERTYSVNVFPHTGE